MGWAKCSVGSTGKVVCTVHWRWEEVSGVMKMARGFSGMKTNMKTSLHEMGGRFSQYLGGWAEIFGFDRIDKMTAEQVLCQRHEGHDEKEVFERCCHGNGSMCIAGWVGNRLVHQGYGQKVAEPTRPWADKNLNWIVPLK